MTAARLLVADVDGTLVTEDGALTARTCDAAERLRAVGVQLAVTSGRPPRGMAMLVGPLHLTAPIAAFNGGMVLEPDLATVIEQCTLPLAVAGEVAAYLLDAAVDVWVYRGADWFICDPAAPYVAREQRTVQFAPAIVDDVRSVLDGAIKVVGVSDDVRHLERCETELRRRVGELASVARSQPYYLDVTHPRANKGEVVRLLARRLGIPLEAVAAIGDMPNDVLMFAVAGTSIAMGNADREVQRAARFVTTSNEAEGFATAVERFVIGERRTARATLGLPESTRACVFDLDDVLVQTTKLHAAAWKEVFDAVLRERAQENGEPFVPFDAGRDYPLYVEDKPRIEAARSFLLSRGIRCADRDAHELVDRHEHAVLRLVRERGVERYEGAVRYLRAVQDAGLRTAVVSSTAHCAEVLARADMSDLADAYVDSATAAERHPSGERSADTYLAAARALGVEPAHAAVFVGSLTGVEAGHAGRFGYLVAVDHVGRAAELRHRGADAVVTDLSALIPG